MRQWGNRYTIHAGRQLIDKEFRYLRTVRVTAAVYQGFNSKLAHLLLAFWHRAGVRPYTSSYDLAESCVFIKQSLPPILCHSLKEYLFSRSYEVILPSSLNLVYSRALVFSTNLPVLVWGTVLYFCDFFLEKTNMIIEIIHTFVSSSYTKRSSYYRNIPSATAFALTLGTVLIE